MRRSRVDEMLSVTETVFVDDNGVKPLSECSREELLTVIAHLSRENATYKMLIGDIRSAFDHADIPMEQPDED